MGKKMATVKQVRIYPANRQQMETAISSAKDPELKKAYTEMLEGCLEHPDQWDWYATEATKLALEWAFSQSGVMAVEAETDPDNIASQKVVEKCGFNATGIIGEEGPRFIVYKEIEIRRATGEELLALWGYQEFDAASPTTKFFYNNITTSNADFWTLDKNGELIAELYVFFNLADKDFADGKTTAYLCAFRVKPEYRGKGKGTQLMMAVLKDLKDRGFRNVTIGVGSDEPQNYRLYQRLGFNTKIKDCYYDPCGMDENMQPKYEETVWWLLQKDL